MIVGSRIKEVLYSQARACHCSGSFFRLSSFNSRSYDQSVEALKEQIHNVEETIGIQLSIILRV